MTETLVRQLEAELRSLRAQLEATEIFKDIQALERVLQRLRGQPQSSAGGGVSEKPQGQGRQEAATTIAMKDAAVRFLEGRGQSALTKDIYDALLEQGIDVPGENPQNNLSAHLSRDSRFLSLGREGWVLASSVREELDAVRTVAERFVGQLPDDEVSSLRAQLGAVGDVPATIDSELLRAARSALKRNLVDKERHTLRAAFKDALMVHPL